MAFALTGIAVLTVFAYPLGLLQSAVVGPVLALVLFLSPIVPAYILGYFIYRYKLFPDCCESRVVLFCADGYCVDVYLLVIRRVAEALGRLDSGSG